MKFKDFFLSNDVGLDLGTSNVLISLENKGVVVKEPAVVAMDKNSKKILTVGSAAQNMLGRTPGNVVAMHPMHDGVVSDYEMTVDMLKILFRKAMKTRFFSPKPRVIVAVPSGVTEVEERTVINAVIEAGARRVYLIEAPLAAGLGAGLDIKDAHGHMVVDIGGGTTDIAVLSMNGVAASSSLELAGDAFDETIMRYVRWKYGMVIGKVTAESMKIQIGCVVPRPENVGIVVNGRDVKNGMARTETITSEDLREALARPARQIADEVLYVLEKASPELVSDIVSNGITLTGGGSQLWGMTDFIAERTGIKCVIAEDPASVVAYGCGTSLAWMNTMKEGPARIARDRAMRGM